MSAYRPVPEPDPPDGSGPGTRHQATVYGLTRTEQAISDAYTRGATGLGDRLAAEVDAQEAEREDRLSRPGALLAVALWYATRGYEVFPLKPGSKAPATAHGFKDAGTDPELACRWWAEDPMCNIGLPTGIAFDVLDIDGPQGWMSWFRVEDRGFREEQPVIAKSLTPRGAHLYIAATGGRNMAAWCPGIDIRGAGGYVVAPPSVLREGAAGVKVPGTYRWANPLGVGEHR